MTQERAPDRTQSLLGDEAATSSWELAADTSIEPRGVADVLARDDAAGRRAASDARDRLLDR